MIETISKSELQAQRENYVRIRDDAARMAAIFKGKPMGSEFEELARCTDAALAALDIAIEATSRMSDA